MLLVINMEKEEAKRKLEKARFLLLEVEIMALRKDMKPFSDELDEMQAHIWKWETLLT